MRRLKIAHNAGYGIFRSTHDLLLPWGPMIRYSHPKWLRAFSVNCAINQQTNIYCHNVKVCAKFRYLFPDWLLLWLAFSPPYLENSYAGILKIIPHIKDE